MNSEDIKTARGLLDVLAETIQEVRQTEGDTLIKARCLAYVCSIALKTVETADLEERLQELEQKVGDKH